MANTYIIAEAGVNHNGSLELAKQLVEVAALSGADAVKFQTFKAEKLVAADAPKATYQLTSTDRQESQLQMLKKLELPYEHHLTLIEHCRLHRIDFLSTPFDEESLQLLHRLQIPLFKVPSGEITNGPLLLQMAQTGTPMILSTGMSTLGEVESALQVIAYGYTMDSQQPKSKRELAQVYMSAEGQRHLQANVKLLHCTTEYPTPYEDVHLRVMETMRQAFQLPIGLSDHTEGIAVPIAAVALGAAVIEKHFTLDKQMPGPDHKASLEPNELAAMVRGIRQVEQALGSGVKVPVPSEMQNISVVRKSIVAKHPIQIGDIFSAENLTFKRPGTGKAPMEFWNLVGTASTRNYQKDEMIE